MHALNIQQVHIENIIKQARLRNKEVTPLKYAVFSILSHQRSADQLYNSPESRVRSVKGALRTFGELIYIKLNIWCIRYC